MSTYSACEQQDVKRARVHRSDRYIVTHLYEHIGQQPGAVELHHTVENVLPAFPQDVAVAVRQAKHGARRQLGLVIRPEQDRYLVRILEK